MPRIVSAFRAAGIFLACLGLGLAAPGAKLAANIFGDGDPGNGIEDSRIDMGSPAWHDRSRQPWNMGAGTIHCEGRNRGSAMIVDTREFGEIGEGLILTTSAHVLYDLDSGRRFEQCRFHYMGLDQLPGYQGDIDLARSRLGDFDPAGARDRPGFGKEDWALLYVSGIVPGVSGSGRVRLRPYARLADEPAQPVRYQFIAYSASARGITISTACRVVESNGGDLGGGGWAGHLLDDCDSEGGASGGGLVASIGAEHYLVGIRSGAHWDGAVFPQSRFPAGPPDGSSWDVHSNTNFSRAIDEELVRNLGLMVYELQATGDGETAF